MSEAALINPEKMTMKAGRSGGKMTWDVTVIDKLLYLVNSIVLLVCGVVLMFIIKPLDTPHKSISCWPPAEFSGAWVQYTNRYCMSTDAALHDKRQNDGDFPGRFLTNETITQSDIYPTRQSNSDFTSPLFLMAILSLLPILCWRLVGTIDGRDFLTGGGHSVINGFVVMLWFLITKVGTVALCVLFVMWITGMKDQGEEYLDVAEYNRKPEDQIALCDFRIRRLGQNIHRYTVQCVISKGKYDVFSLSGRLFSFEHILGSTLKSLQIWLLTLLVVNVINLLATAIFVLSSADRSSRINFIRKYVPYGADTVTYEKINRKLGFTGAVVFNLAARLGHGELVKNSFTELCAPQN